MEIKDVQKDLFGAEIKDSNLQRNLNGEEIPPKKDKEKPPLESTTLWDYPTQSYGKTPKGNNKFQGVTPAFIIYNMVMRYTKEGDTVLDPMCGSGTTIDVCLEEGRKPIGYDIHPNRPDIIKNDSRRIPLENNSIDMVFIDSPYGDNVNYSDDPENIGKISAESVEFYNELEKVAKELFRVLKPGKVLGWLIGDQWVKKRFTPVGFKTYQMLTERVGFEPVDLICVARRNQSSNTRLWHYRAVKWNFYLRGFKYLFIVRKPDNSSVHNKPGNTGEGNKITWQKYK
ncbi:MAG: DNA methyltransferase [Thermoplasmatales archaeon]